MKLLSGMFNANNLFFLSFFFFFVGDREGGIHGPLTGVGRLPCLQDLSCSLKKKNLLSHNMHSQYFFFLKRFPYLAMQSDKFWSNTKVHDSLMPY